MQNGKKAANGCVIAPATRFILSLLISPDGVIIPLSKSTLFMSSSFIFVVLKKISVHQINKKIIKMCFLYTLNDNSMSNPGHTLAFVERYLAEQRTCRNKQHFFPVLFRKLL